MVTQGIGIAVLGCTGSIGSQTLDVVERFPDRLKVVALAADSSADAVARQVERHHPAFVSMMNADAAAALRSRVPRANVGQGMEGLVAAATHPDVRIVVVSVKGAIGLIPTLAAIESGKTVALASKEVLVAGGDVVMRRARERGVDVVPIDSEHSAIFQCLHGENAESVEAIVLTASGGPFREWSAERLAAVTAEDALAHPTWNMGPKITVDSATLMNKGLEVIEAHWLFGVPADRIEVVVHPQSIIHSMVRYRDGSVLAQMGLPDMRLPIQYALFHPERPPNDLERLNLARVGTLTFEEPDLERFPCLALAYKAAATGMTAPAILSAANEEAVDLFLSGNLSFTGIPYVVGKALTESEPVEPREVGDVLAADAWARHFVRRFVEQGNWAP
jgi:1-deoxy-D-xylulose-5-phosphate reductoisomerase